MILLPAIDLMDGQVVRLRQGRADQKTVYAGSPVEFAQKWESDGGEYLHIVDLDAAFTGVMHNIGSVRKITEAVSIPCELGGGIRSEKSIDDALNSGIERVVIGTRATESMEFVEKMVAKFGSERIAVGIDAKDGIVSVKGWTESAGIQAFTLAKEAESAGAGTIIYTDIATDGMLTGPNFSELQKLMDTVHCNVIASGGVSKAEDVHQLREIEGLYGVIIGTALYDGAITLAEVHL
jgi:phosphoribosylformimino-5-aminoimidazole carboxamide ribotide isomerase